MSLHSLLCIVMNSNWCVWQLYLCQNEQQKTLLILGNRVSDVTPEVPKRKLLYLPYIRNPLWMDFLPWSFSKNQKQIIKYGTENKNSRNDMRNVLLFNLNILQPSSSSSHTHSHHFLYARIALQIYCDSYCISKANAGNV